MPIPRKLPLWRTVWQAYRGTFGSLGYLFRISWLWLLITTPILTICLALLWSLEAQGTIDEGMSWDALGVLLPPFLSPIAVAWMRWLLIGERVAARGYLRLDAVVLRSIPSFFLASLIGVGLSTITYLPWSWFNAAWDLEMYGVALSMILPPVAIVFLTISVSARLSAVLPAKALAMNQVTFADAWRATRENSWRLIVGTLVCSYAPLLIGWFVYDAVVAEAKDVSVLADFSSANPFSPAGLALAGLTVVAICGLYFPWLSFIAFFGNYLLELTTTEHGECPNVEISRIRFDGERFAARDA
jgi:hypothetical protein